MAPAPMVTRRRRPSSSSSRTKCRSGTTDQRASNGSAAEWRSRRGGQGPGPTKWRSCAVPRVPGCGRSPIATATPTPAAWIVGEARSCAARPTGTGGSNASARPSARRWLARSGEPTAGLAQLRTRGRSALPGSPRGRRRGPRQRGRCRCHGCLPATRPRARPASVAAHTLERSPEATYIGARSPGPQGGGMSAARRETLAVYRGAAIVSWSVGTLVSGFLATPLRGEREPHIIGLSSSPR